MSRKNGSELLDSSLVLQYIIFSGNLDGELCGNLRNAIRCCAVSAVTLEEVHDVINRELEKQNNEIVKSVLNKVLKEIDKRA